MAKSRNVELKYWRNGRAVVPIAIGSGGFTVNSVIEFLNDRFGEMAERSNAAVLKTVVLYPRDRGFESLFLRQRHQICPPDYMGGFLFYEKSRAMLTLASGFNKTKTARRADIFDAFEAPPHGITSEASNPFRDRGFALHCSPAPSLKLPTGQFLNVQAPLSPPKASNMSPRLYGGIFVL